MGAGGLLNLNLGRILEQPFAVKTICFLALIFVATLGLWVRPTLFGVDSYATLGLIRFGFDATLSNQPVANFFFSLLPDSIVLFKFIMFASIAAAVAPIFLLVKRFYDERTAWIATFLLLGLSPVILFGFGEFENEIFAYPLITWGIYFLLRKDYLKAVVCGAASLLFWKWVYYFTFFNTGGAAIAEMQLFAGLVNLWALIPFILFISFIDNRFARILGGIAIIFWLWNAKLFIFLLPFVCLAIAQVLNWVESD